LIKYDANAPHINFRTNLGRIQFKTLWRQIPIGETIKINSITKKKKKQTKKKSTNRCQCPEKSIQLMSHRLAFPIQKH